MEEVGSVDHGWWITGWCTGMQRRAVHGSAEHVKATFYFRAREEREKLSPLFSLTIPALFVIYDMHFLPVPFLDEALSGFLIL